MHAYAEYLIKFILVPAVRLILKLMDYFPFLFDE